MAIDSRTEELLTLAEARSLIPGRVDLATIWRWSRIGVRGRTLETVWVGGRLFTSCRAIERFLERDEPTARGRDGRTAQARRQLGPARKKSIDAAREKLRAGLAPRRRTAPKK